MTSRLLPLCALAVLAACRGSEADGRAAGPGGRGGPGGAERVVAVEIAPVATSSITRSVDVAGVVEPIRTVQVNSRLSSVVTAIGAEEGDRVGTGTVLARLDATELRAQLASAQAEYEVAGAAWERARQLREEQIITLPEFERDRAAYAAAGSALEQLRTRVGYATVRSPLGGVVVEKNVEAGDVVAAQQPLFRVADVSTLVVRIGVSELDVVDLAPGELVGVTLDAAPGRPLNGRIRRVFPAADPATRLVPVEIALQDEGVARPGFLARVRLPLETRDSVSVVPAGAVVTSAAGDAVFVVREGRAERRPVETGLTSEGRVEILDGVEPGELIVVTGQATLRDGTAVRPVDRSAPRPASDRPVRGST